MSSMLPETALAFEQGDSPDLTLGPFAVTDRITGVQTAIDLTQSGIQLWLTAKKSRADNDAAAMFQKTIGSGITVNSPVSTAKNLATCRIAIADTTSGAFATAYSANITDPVTLYYDVQLLEPDGRKTTVARGTITVTPQVTRA